MQASAVDCAVCECTFSRDGYLDHLDGEHRCRNWHEALKGALDCSLCSLIIVDVFTVPRLALLPAPTLSITSVLDVPIFEMEKWTDSAAPSLAALSEWNSRVGVRKDVWAIISTMEVQCPTCRMVRSAPAHRRHLVGRKCPLV